MKALKIAPLIFTLVLSVGTISSCKSKHKHVYDAGIVTLEPTCTKDGVKTFTCKCGDTYTEKINSKGHTEVKDAAVAADCTHDGKTEGSHCSVCGETITPQTTIAASHTVVTDPAVAADCTHDGKTEGSHCSVCGETITPQTTVPASHTAVTDPAVAADCTHDGKTEGSHCSVCGETITPQTKTDALGHAGLYTGHCTHEGCTEGYETKELSYEAKASFVKETLTKNGYLVYKIVLPAGTFKLVVGKDSNSKDGLSNSKFTLYESDGRIRKDAFGAVYLTSGTSQTYYLHLNVIDYTKVDNFSLECQHTIDEFGKCECGKDASQTIDGFFDATDTKVNCPYYPEDYKVYKYVCSTSGYVNVDFIYDATTDIDPQVTKIYVEGGTSNLVDDLRVSGTIFNFTQGNTYYITIKNMSDEQNTTEGFLRFHQNIVRHAYAGATPTSEGHIEYYTCPCSYCSSFYFDKDGNRIEGSSVSLAKLNYSNYTKFDDFIYIPTRGLVLINNTGTFTGSFSSNDTVLIYNDLTGQTVETSIKGLAQAAEASTQTSIVSSLSECAKFEVLFSGLTKEDYKDYTGHIWMLK